MLQSLQSSVRINVAGSEQTNCRAHRLSRTQLSSSYRLSGTGSGVVSSVRVIPVDDTLPKAYEELHLLNTYTGYTRYDSGGMCADIYRKP